MKDEKGRWTIDLTGEYGDSDTLCSHPTRRRRTNQSSSSSDSSSSGSSSSANSSSSSSLSSDAIVECSRCTTGNAVDPDHHGMCEPCFQVQLNLAIHGSRTASLTPHTSPQQSTQATQEVKVTCCVCNTKIDAKDVPDNVVDIVLCKICYKNSMTLHEQHDEICNICHEVLQPGKSEITITPCNHAFCSACLFEWFKVSRSRAPTCPCCRKEVTVCILFLLFGDGTITS